VVGVAGEALWQRVLHADKDSRRGGDTVVREGGGWGQG
jgi:hypothetical protein